MQHRSIESIKAGFEARGVKALEAIMNEAPPSDEWIDTLIAGAADPRASVPATWMIRAYLKAGVELDRRQTAQLLRSLPRIENDDARLHICQSVAELEVPARNAEQLARFLRDGFSGAHKFTRAWAVDAFQRLSLQHPRYRREALACLDRASRDPAASVRARARRIAKDLGG